MTARYVVLAGNLTDGYTAYGPFKDTEGANRWGDKHCGHTDWHVADLQEPDTDDGFDTHATPREPLCETEPAATHHALPLTPGSHYEMLGFGCMVTERRTGEHRHEEKTLALCWHAADALRIANALNHYAGQKPICPPPSG